MKYISNLKNCTKFINFKKLQHKPRSIYPRTKKHHLTTSKHRRCNHLLSKEKKSFFYIRKLKLDCFERMVQSVCFIECQKMNKNIQTKFPHSSDAELCTIYDRTMNDSHYLQDQRKEKKSNLFLVTKTPKIPNTLELK